MTQTAIQPAIEFQPWPKIARLNRAMIITEKIDGTNAAVIITDDGRVAAQSRNRLITPADDNYGFARWVEQNADGLAATLGPGRHFGEWWGSGVQRGYGLTQGQKRFSLFNVGRWADVEFADVPNLALVPTLHKGPFDTAMVNIVHTLLALHGSKAAPGFMQPEGIVIFHTAAQSLFKVTIDGDAVPKSLQETAS